MTTTASTSLDQLTFTDHHASVLMVTPRSGAGDMATLLSVFQANRAFFMDKLARRGVLLFRGFAPQSKEAFHDLVTQGMAMDPWNGFNLKGMPGFAANWLRKYTEGLMGSGDYRRYLDANTVQLGPVGDSVQGPHVEGGGSPRRARYLALCCFQPAAHLAETGMVNMHEVYMQLPEALKQKYVKALNRFYFITGRKLNAIDRLILSQSPVKVLDVLDDGRAKLATATTPAVCTHPETGDLCLQPWAFARNTNEQAHAAAEAVFQGRGEIKRCPNADGTNYIWDLCDIKNQVVEWTESEKRELFEAMYRHSFLMEWQKGDIALVDNVRMGHWRMNGEQGNRQLVQIQVGSLNADEHRPAALAN